MHAFGAFALLLSVALLVFVPYWREQPNYAALRRYLAGRLNLANEVDHLSDDPYWQKYKASHDGAESMSIAELLNTDVQTSTETKADAVQPKRAAASHHQTPKGGVRAGPVPPTLIGVIVTEQVKIDRMKRIADALGQLNDAEVLTLSRRVSNFFEFSIVRWVEKRNGLAYRNQITNNCFTEQLELPGQVKRSSDFVPALQNEGMLKCLTLRDVHELAHIELPTLSSPPELGEHIGTRIEVTPGSLPRDLYTASILAQVLLFFAMVHFNAFVREAVSSANFPVPGTLFSAFSRSRATLFIFSSATCVPLLASALVCWASWASASTFLRLSLLACGVFIAWAFLSVQLVLWRKSYFKALIHHRKPVLQD